MRWLVATVVGTLALAGSGGTASATTNVVATGFVAVTTGSGTLQISLFNLDGSHERRMTSGPANHRYPSASPDGTQLLYTGDEGGVEEIYKLTLVSPAVPVRITSPPLTANSASWSPDGKSIVYSALVHGAPTYQIFVADPDGTNVRQLTHTTDAGNAQPVFSPDGVRVAYINGREETGPGPNGSAVTAVANRIWVVGSDGSGATPLTLGPLDAYPAWLDASTVLFARSSFLSESSQIISVRLAGAEQVLSPPNQYFVEPRPAPDGRSYGATMKSGTELHLARISRVDMSMLATPSAGEFVVKRLPIPAADGPTFTMSWVLGPRPTQPPRRIPAIPTMALEAAGVLALLLAGAYSYRRPRSDAHRRTTSA